MSLDVSVLQALRRRDRYDKIVPYMDKGGLEESTITLLRYFGRFFKDNPEVREIPLDPFMSWFKLKNPKMSEEKRVVWRKTLTTVLKGELDPVVESSLVEQLVVNATAARAMTLLERYRNGDEDVDFTAELRGLAEEHTAQLNRKVRMPEVTDDVADLLEVDEHNIGFQWSIEAFSDSIRAAQTGDFIIIAARPDAGKTTWLSAILAHWAPQVDKLFPGENRYIIWFNNEGPGKRIKRRVYQSALRKTISGLVELKHAGKLHSEYAKAVGGRADVIKVFDIHGFSAHEVEEIIAKMNPAVCVFDMIDNIKFGGEIINGGSRKDEVLEAMYQKVREWAVKYDFVAVATSQASGDAEGIAYPDQTMLKDSKTGKQGAADLITFLGKSNSEGLDNSRFVSAPKNKLRLENAVQKVIQREVVFDADRAQVRDPT